MKRMKKVCAVMLGVAMLVGVTAYAAVSNSASQDGIQAVIQTDKNSYAANEDIQVNITVTNTNGHTVRNVSIEGLLPDDLTLKDGSLQSDTVNLGAGETLTLDCVAVLEKEIVTDPETTEPETTEPDTTEPATEPPTEPESSTELPTESEPVVTEPIEPTTETTEPEETETDTTLPETTTEETTTPESTTEESSTVEPTTTEPTTVEPSTDHDTTVPETEEPSTEEDTTDGGIILPVEPTTDRNSPSTTEPDSSTENTPANPNTSDSSTVIKVLACLAVAGAVVVAIVVIQKKNSKKATRVISLVLCGAIAISGIATTGFLSVSAEEDTSRSFTVQTVITVDGGDYTLEGKVNYEVSATEEGDVKLYSDPKELSTSDAPQDVLFYIDTENTTGVCDVTLFDAENGKELAGMQDNGKNGDKIAGDGVYSTTLSMDCSEETTVQYYAVIDDGITKVKSKVREINIFAPMTDEEAENMETVDNRLSDLTESTKYVDASNDVKANLMKQELEDLLDEKLILDYEFNEEELMFSYQYKNGIIGSWHIDSNKDYLSAGVDDDFTLDFINRNRLNYSIKSEMEKTNIIGNGLIIYGWHDSDDDNSNLPSYTNIANSWVKAGFATTIVNLPSVNDFKTLLNKEKYQYIEIAEHGLSRKDELGNEKYYICTKDQVSKSKDIKYSSDLKGKNPRVIKDGNEYALSPEFFSFYYEDKLDDSIINMSVCMSVGSGQSVNYDFSNAFISWCDASNFIGYHNPVMFGYVLRVSNALVGLMITENMNIQEAIDYIYANLGKTDIEYFYKIKSNDEEWITPNPETGKTLKQEIDDKNNKDGEAHLILKGNPLTTIGINFAGGDGSINNPYQIETAQQLNAVRYHLDSNFVLIDDIDLSGYNWVPIGGVENVHDGFCGNFDGQGHTISNLNITYEIPARSGIATYSFGLFSDSTDSSGIKNFNLKDIEINITGQSTAMMNKTYISGVSALASNISNVNVSGKVNVSLQGENIYISGIANSADRIENCVNQANITASIQECSGYKNITGIVSELHDGVIKNCTNRGDISVQSYEDRGNTRCAGIVAVSGISEILNCSNKGKINCNAEQTIYLGGIVSESTNDSISGCSNYGNLESTSKISSSDVAGIVSQFSSTYYGGGATIKNCVNFGNISSESDNLDSVYGQAYCGGIISRISGDSQEISYCYNLSDTLKAEGYSFEMGRIFANDLGGAFKNYSLDSTLLNGAPATQNIGPDQKNGGSMTRAEIEKAVTDLGFELPGQTE